MRLNRSFHSSKDLYWLLFFLSPLLVFGAGDELNCSSATATDADGCCYNLAYDYNFPQNVTSLETTLLTPFVTFSAINYPLASGWQYEVLQNQRRLRWTYQQGGEIPTGEQMLFDFCLEGWNADTPVELLVRWRTGELVTQNDTLRLNCFNCWAPLTDSVECQPDSSYLYTFDFLNQSGFAVDFLTIREPQGQDFIVQPTIAFANSLASGAVSSSLQLAISNAADGLTEVCFEITPSRLRQIGDETVALECCTRAYCLPLPECDRCCTDYNIFEADVAAGFQTSFDCENGSVSLQALQLNDCDRVVFEVVDLGSGVIEGDQTITFAGFEDETAYEVCMTVTRQDRTGENCYEEASLTICDSFFYDCEDCVEPEQIELDFDCPIELDLVCGCDSMTYFNACAAENWAGLTLWEEGRRCDDGQISEIILSVTWIVLANEASLSWQTTGLVDYRYFLVQRMLPDEEWVTIDVVDNATFTYTDFGPADGLNKYRIVGVVNNGKVVFSNEGPIVDTEEVHSLPGGRIWPNPVNDYLQIELPLPEAVPLAIHNAQGQSILQVFPSSNGTVRLSVAEWPPGYYLLTARWPDGKIWRRPFIIN